MTTHSIRDIFFTYNPELMLIVLHQRAYAAILRCTKCYHEIDAIIKIIELLCEACSDFPQKLLATDEKYTKLHHRHAFWHTTRYVHTDQAGIYPYRPDMIAHHTRRIEKAGLWLKTNLSSNQTRKMMGEACEAADVRFTFLESFES